MPRHSKFALIFASMFFALSIPGQSEGLEKTIGMLNSDFKTFRISRNPTSNEKIEAFKYEFPLQGLESDSKQNLTGVIFYLGENGEIVRIQPLVANYILPDQKDANASISANEKASDFLARNQFENLSDLQAYGLLSKWATAVLSRKDGINLNLEMTNMQKSSIKKIFAGKLQIPDLEAGNGQENNRKIEKFAKDILQIELY